METPVEATIRFSPEMHCRLTALAARTGRSVGDLVSAVCERQYGGARGDRASAVAALARMELPVGSPEVMKWEWVVRP